MFLGICCNGFFCVIDALMITHNFYEFMEFEVKGVIVKFMKHVEVRKYLKCQKHKNVKRF